MPSVDRISQEKWNCTGKTSYYLYDPRGSVTGLTSQKGQLCRTYQYSPYGEITFGASSYENEYTYNGESYNPNIHSQYLRARYYNVVTADFLTQDSYLGSILEPLTLNRYSYCVGNPVNFRDPSGHTSTFLDDIFERFITNTITAILKNWSSIVEFSDSDIAGEIKQACNQSTESYRQGAVDSFVILIGSVAKPATAYINGIGLQSTFIEELEKENRKLDNYLQNRAEASKDVTSYYAGRCAGDAAQQIFAAMVGNTIVSQGSVISVMPTTSMSGRDIMALHNGVALELNYGRLITEALVGASAASGLTDFYKSSQNLGGSDSKGDSETPDTINYDSKQVGKKYGEHMKDYPDMKDYTEYKDYADEVFKSPDQIIHDIKNGEYYYTKGEDLLRIKENGDFVSLYPGAESGRVLDAIENGGTIWP